MERLIITAAVDGAEVTREQNPHLPINPREIAADAKACREAGAAMLHVHGRHDDGAPTQSAEVYAAIIREVRACTDIIIQVSTGGAVGMAPDERLQPVFLKPEMATLTAGTVNFGRDVFMNPLEVIEEFARTMAEQGVTPEIEAFDMGHIATALALVKKGVLRLPLHFDFVMGVPGGIAPSVKNLLLMTESIPPDCTWTVAGIGRAQLPLANAAILLGGHVRVGLEDNIYYEKGVLASNPMLVARVIRLARELGREAATPDEARRILRLTSEPSN